MEKETTQVKNDFLKIVLNFQFFCRSQMENRVVSIVVDENQFEEMSFEVDRLVKYFN